MNVGVDTFQHVQTRLGDTRDRKPPVLLDASTFDQPAGLETVDEPCDVRSVIDHAGCNFTSRISLGMGVAKDSQRVVLSMRDLDLLARIVYESAERVRRQRED